MTGARRAFERTFPRLFERLARLNYQWRFAGKATSSVFDDIFKRNAWRGTDSLSGTGSDLVQTQEIRRALPCLLREFGIRSLLDIPCGDFHWMRHVELDLDRYIGADVVARLVEENAQRFADRTRFFAVYDLTRDALPDVDLILCRDCLVHLSFSDIHRALANINRTSARYLLTTTFVGRQQNHDIRTGAWRPINLELPPFSLGAPVSVITEHCSEDGGAYVDKSLGLWSLPLLVDADSSQSASDVSR